MTIYGSAQVPMKRLWELSTNIVYVIYFLWPRSVMLWNVKYICIKNAKDSVFVQWYLLTSATSYYQLFVLMMCVNFNCIIKYSMNICHLMWQNLSYDTLSLYFIIYYYHTLLLLLLLSKNGPFRSRFLKQKLKSRLRNLHLELPSLQSSICYLTLNPW